MIEMYGHKFTSSYGEVPNDTWSAALAGIYPEQIGEALQACFRRQDTWPPTLPEFIEMCCPTPVTNSLYFPDAMKALPPPRPSKEYAAEQIAKIREKL